MKKLELTRYKRILYPMLLILCAALSLFIFAESVKEYKVTDKVYFIKNHNDKKMDDIYYQPLTRGVTVRQTFKADSNFDGVSATFHSDSKEPEGKIYFEIRRKDTGEVVYENEADISRMDRDILVDFRFENDDRGLSDVEYLITMYGDAENAENAMSVYIQNAGMYPGEYAVNGGNVDDRALGLGAYKITRKNNVLYKAILIAAVMAFGAVCFCVLTLKLRQEVTALIAILAFGGLYMLILPPGKLCDSKYHFGVVCQYSSDLLGWTQKNSDNIYVTENELEVYNKCFYEMDSYYGQITSKDYLNQKSAFRMFDKEQKLTVLGARNNESVVPYIPAVAGLSAARLLHLGAIPAVYMARLVQLIILAGMISLAVKITPVGKTLFMIAAMLPMSLQQLGAFSYDGMCIAAVFVLTASWLSYIYGEDKDTGISFRYILMLISAALIGASKNGIYVMIPFIVIALSKDKLSRKKKTGIILAVIVSAILCNFAKYFGVLGEASGIIAQAADDSKYIPGQSYTLSYAFDHPLQFILMCAGSLVERFDYYTGSTTGTYMGGNIEMVPAAVGAVFWILLILSAIPCMENINDKKMNTPARWTAVAAVFITCCFMFFMMQVSTPVGWNIQGVSGRYFIPLIPLLFMAVRSDILTVKKDIGNKLLIGFAYWQIIEIFYLGCFIFSK